MEDDFWILPLEDKDRKKLRKHKLISTIFFIYLILIVVGSFIAFVFIYFLEGDSVGGWFGLISLGVLIPVLMIYRHLKHLKNDLKDDQKHAKKSVLEKKKGYKNRLTLVISGESFQVGAKDFFRFKKGDQVLVTYGPKSKTMLDLHLVDKDHS